MCCRIMVPLVRNVVLVRVATNPVSVFASTKLGLHNNVVGTLQHSYYGGMRSCAQCTPTFTVLQEQNIGIVIFKALAHCGECSTLKQKRPAQVGTRTDEGRSRLRPRASLAASDTPLPVHSSLVRIVRPNEEPLYYYTKVMLHI